jgi:hypothetical protein
VHNPALQLILQSLATGNRKSSWISAEAEKKAVEWAEKKIRDEVAALAAGNLAGGDSIGWKGDIAGARQILIENASYPNANDRWTSPTGVRPMSWATFVNNSEIYRYPMTFKWYRRNGSVGGTKHLDAVFNSHISELPGTAAQAGITEPTLGRRKVRVTSNPLPAEPPRPHPWPMLTDPTTDFTQGQTYLHNQGGQWMTVTLAEYDDAPAVTTFKAVFRKTTDPQLTYKVYTAYPA